MQLERIISLANGKSRIPFLAMERSLRATGCDLPMDVIPYDEELFDLPKGSTWWKIPEIWDWLHREKGHPMMYKYQCLTTKNYHYVDTDICFLRNPAEVLKPYSGWIAACTDWNHPEWTFTEESSRLMYQRRSLWKRTIFCAGQFACDTALYTIDSLKTTVLRPDFVYTCLRFPIHDQPGMNLLVFEAGIPFVNLTLPPINMESTWAGDYIGEYEHLWPDPERKPYLIHWAGNRLDYELPINRIFYDFLTREERSEWDEHMRGRYANHVREYRSRLSWGGRRVHDLKQLAKAVLRLAGVSVGHQRANRSA